MRDADVIFEWSVWPMGSDRGRALLFVAVVIVVPVLIGLRFGANYWVLISPLFLLGALNRFWVRQHYRVSETEIEFRRWWFQTTHPLAGYKRMVVGPAAVFLSPFDQPSRLDPYRGLWVQLGPRGDEFARWLEQKIPRAER